MNDPAVMGIHRGQGNRFTPAADFLGGVERLLLENVLFAGVAISTVIATGASSFLVISFLIKETDELHLDIKKLGLNTQLLSKMLKTGIPSGLQYQNASR